MWRTEQKSLSWIKHLVWKANKAGKLMMDLCAGTCSTAKAFMMLADQQRKSVAWDFGPELPSAPEPDHVLTFVSQVRNRTLDISESGEVESATTV